MLKRLFYFPVYSNLFIAACAVLMAWETCGRLHSNVPPGSLSGFLFFSTLLSYSFHWYLTPAYTGNSSRVRWLQHYRPVHLAFFVAGLAGTIFYFIPMAGHWFWIAGGALATFLYSAPKLPYRFFRWLRSIAIGKTLFLAFMWTYATAVLPVLITDEPAPPGWLLFTLGRFLLLYPICILFDIRDREYDKKTGIRSLITILSEKQAGYIFWGSLTASAVCTLLLAGTITGLASAFSLLAPVVLTACLYNYARRHFSDLLYYLVLDGFMALSAILYLLTGI